VHLLGPVAKAERAPIELVRASAIVRGRHLAVLAPDAHGHCTFLADDMRCAIHDGGIKPRSCARYPFLLAATPAGGRIGTDHRCPCRTMGERPLLTVEAALPSLLDRRGRLSADRRIEDRVPITRGRRVSFARYEAIEADVLAAVDEPPVLPRREAARIARAMDTIAEAPTRWGAMHAAFARGIEAHAENRPCAPFARPWAESFARAEARSPSTGDTDAMLADWRADAIWALEWTFSHPLDRARVELAFRADVARVLADAIETTGARADTAMAEAIAVVEVAGLSDVWTGLAAGSALRPH
jgi:hypothetical protein